MITKIEETPQPKQNKKPHLNPKVTLPTDNSQKRAPPRNEQDNIQQKTKVTIA